MQGPTVNKVQETRNGEKEVEFLQSLAILELRAIDNAKGSIFQIEEAHGVQEQDVSQIEEADKIIEFLWVSGNFRNREEERNYRYERI